MRAHMGGPPASKNSVTMMNVNMLTMTPRVALRMRTGESSVFATMGAAGAVGFAAPAILPALARISSTRFMNFAAGTNLRLMVFMVAGAVEYHCCKGAHIISTRPAVAARKKIKI